MYNKIKNIHLAVLMSFILILLITSCKNKVKRYNIEASLANEAHLSENPLDELAMTALVNTREHTMSTLYGNKVSVDYASISTDGHYPAGAILYLVTWQQQEDALWFGARIPAAIASVEKVMFQTDGEGNAVPVYALYKGRSLKKEDGGDPAVIQERLAFIVHEGMAVSP